MKRSTFDALESQLTQSHPAVSLQITRGQTKFAHRPIETEDFLIGSSSACDLQLGGSIPEFHSLITRGVAELQIVSLASQPSLLVNGVSLERCPLHNKDQVRIGNLEFVLRMSEVSPVAALDDLSAGELVDLMARELETIESVGNPDLVRAEHDGNLHNLLSRLTALSAELDERSQELVQREREFAKAADFLLKAQATISARLDSLRPDEEIQQDLSAA